MKLNVNIRDYFADHSDVISVPVNIDFDEILECAGIPEEEEFDFDLETLLDEHRQVAVIWTIDHVQETRPDLSDDQSWEVLKLCRARWGSCQGIDWEVIEKTAQELYPESEQHWHGRIDVYVTDCDGHGQAEVIDRLRDMADLLARDMPDVRASADDGSIRRIHPVKTATE